MRDLTNQQYLRTQQYRDASNLNARIQLHARFSTNPGSWYEWVYDQIMLPEHCQILELGCGPADFWRANLPRIPQGWDVTLTDLSEGMIAQAQENLKGARPFSYKVMDAQQIAYEDARFDAVFANHMLYHVPGRPRALAEIRRVLKPGGSLYATTIGEKHMQELLALPYRFDSQRARDALQTKHEFTLESGLPQLEAFFQHVNMRRYPDSLHVTETAPLVEYILSTFDLGTEEQQKQFFAFIEREMERSGGAIDITKDSGMFIAS